MRAKTISSANNISQNIEKKPTKNEKLPSNVEEAKKFYSSHHVNDNANDSYNKYDNKNCNYGNDNSNDDEDSYHNNKIEASREIAKTIDELNQLEKLKKILLAKEDHLKLIIKNYMEFHTYLTLDNLTIASWKKSTRKSFDLAKFKNEFPDLHASYLQDISVRTFRLL